MSAPEGALGGRVAIVAGVGAGIGGAVATALAREGADVVLANRTREVAEGVAKEVEAQGRRALVVPTDVTDAEARQALVDAALEAFGGLDVLVANAFSMGKVGALESSDPERDWRAAFKVNLFGALGLARAALPALRARGGGSIVFVNSMSSRRPEPLMMGYGASKAALLFAARQLATEVGADEIRVNSVVPGWVDGPALDVGIRLDADARGVSREAVRAEIAARGCLPRIPKPREIAEAVAFLASPRASAITGQSLDVNCGAWLG